MKLSEIREIYKMDRDYQEYSTWLTRQRHLKTLDCLYELIERYNIPRDQTRKLSNNIVKLIMSNYHLGKLFGRFLGSYK